MAFKIVNETYYVEKGREPEVYGYIEGYTSNTVGETYLRINCKCLIDEEKIDWYKRCWTELPTIPIHPSCYLDKKGCRPIQDGDIIGEGVRLNKKQVKQLIKELEKWLRKGY